jgi:hypothetical protein
MTDKPRPRTPEEIWAIAEPEHFQPLARDLIRQLVWGEITEQEYETARKDAGLSSAREMYDQGLVTEEEWLAIGEQIHANLEEERRRVRGTSPFDVRRRAELDQSLADVTTRNQETRRRIEGN